MATSKSISEPKTITSPPAKYSQRVPSLGRPLRTAPLVVPSSISAGDHILYRINTNDDYRPIYRSALVESVTNTGNVDYIEYTQRGVQRKTQSFRLFESLHKVDYAYAADDAMNKDAAITKARERLGECHYHGLFNNSHHFVSWAKTGVEYSLTDLVLGIAEGIHKHTFTIISII